MSQIHRQHRKRIRVVNRGRLAIFISILLIITYPAIMFAIDKPSSDLSSKSFIKVYIEPGDTLWGIAKANLPPKTDIRDFVHEIKVVNELNSSLIREGEVILVPCHP